jgi:hypothetical protein
MVSFFGGIYILLLLVQHSIILASAAATSKDANCSLTCKNGGDCRIGRTDVDQGDGVNATNSTTTPDDTSTNKHGHYCFCPTGYAGSNCEIKFKLCDTAQETCFGGEPCRRGVDDAGHVFFHCECDAQQSDNGRFCEHAATNFCKNGDKTSLGTQSGSYCANSGICLDKLKGKHHSGCQCAPGWAGLHCETPEYLYAKMQQSVKKDYGFIWTITITVTVAVGAFMFRQSQQSRVPGARTSRRRRVKRRGDFELVEMNSTRSTTSSSTQIV